jgi:streptogramin lyase
VQYNAGGPTSGLIIGPDQNIWFDVGGDIAFFNPSTLAIQSFFATAGLIQELAVGSDGNVWFAFLEQSWIGRTLYARRRRADLADGRMVVRSRARR